MQTQTLSLENLAGSKILLGIHYIDKNTNELLAQRVYGGSVLSADKDAISIGIGADTKDAFNIPSDLSAWFVAPKGRYPIPHGEQVIIDPDYLVAWNVYRTQPKTAEDGQHEWWEWRPCAEAPQVQPT